MSFIEKYQKARRKQTIKHQLYINSEILILHSSASQDKITTIIPTTSYWVITKVLCKCVIYMPLLIFTKTISSRSFYHYSHHIEKELRFRKIQWFAYSDTELRLNPGLFTALNHYMTLLFVCFVLTDELKTLTWHIILTDHSSLKSQVHVHLPPGRSQHSCF